VSENVFLKNINTRPTGINYGSAWIKFGRLKFDERPRAPMQRQRDDLRIVHSKRMFIQSNKIRRSIEFPFDRLLTVFFLIQCPH